MSNSAIKIKCSKNFANSIDYHHAIYAKLQKGYRDVISKPALLLYPPIG